MKRLSNTLGLGVIAFLLPLTACASEPVVPGPSAKPAAPPAGPSKTPPKPPSPSVPELKPTWPVGAIGPPPEPRPCAARIELESRREGGRIHLSATLTSNSDQPVEITLRHACPGGPLSFVGLGQGFDYYGTCNMGACIEPDAQTRLLVPAGGQTITVASLSWPEAGDGCRAKLEPGRYDINGFGELVAPEGSSLCGLAHTRLEIPAPPKPPTPAHRCPPMPTCGLACEGGAFARDENGCSRCACADEPWGTRPKRPPLPKR